MQPDSASQLHGCTSLTIIPTTSSALRRSRPPLYALADVKAKIEAVGDRVASEERAKCGDIIPERALKPDHVVDPGVEVIDGARFEFRDIRRPRCGRSRP